jgi:hypothetical protein
LNERPIAAISYNQASYRLGVRDTFIGWSIEERKRYLPHILNNNRYPNKNKIQTFQFKAA